MFVAHVFNVLLNLTVMDCSHTICKVSLILYQKIDLEMHSHTLGELSFTLPGAKTSFMYSEETKLSIYPGSERFGGGGGGQVPLLLSVSDAFPLTDSFPEFIFYKVSSELFVGPHLF